MIRSKIFIKRVTHSPIRAMRISLFILVIMVTCISCKKESVNTGEKVEIYLLKTYQRVTNKCQIDPSFSILHDTATVMNEDILEYSKSDYTFTLNEKAMQKVRAFRDFTPFAVTVDKQVIYYGFFKPSISSSSCDNSITMDIEWTTGSKIFLRLGYPGTPQGVSIDDQRNNEKLLKTLKNQGKLR